MNIARILVGLDFSKASRLALEQSVALAKTLGAEVHVLHRVVKVKDALQSASSSAGDWVSIGGVLDELDMRQRTDRTKELDALVRRSAADISIDYSIAESGSASEALTNKAESWNADLVSLGTHGTHGLEKLVLGSVASDVLHRLDRPVLFVAAEARTFSDRIRTILVPVDFSDHSHRALAMARALALQYQASLHLLHAVEVVRTPFSPGGLTSRFELEPGLAERYEEALRDMLGPSTGEITVEDGSPAGTILWAREDLEADLIVMGSRGLTGLPHLLAGSVADKVARFSDVPVIVVR